MIDTDKYEGHTPGPWSDKTALYWVTEEDDGSYQVDIDHKPDKLLIHDAPLLLEEVKRLRGKVKQYKKAYEISSEALREHGMDYCIYCFRVYCDTSVDGLEEIRHQNGECLT